MAPPSATLRVTIRKRGRIATMNIKLHHLNLTTSNVPALDKFYRDVLGLDQETSRNANRVATSDPNGYGGKVAFVTDGTTEMHLAERDLSIAFKQKQAINPLERGHIAFRTDDIEAFKKHLDKKGIPYSDYGAWAMGGWYQIFFQDPDGNTIEVHQVMK
jgi:glyoxylase I family protein